MSKRITFKIYLKEEIRRVSLFDQPTLEELKALFQDVSRMNSGFTIKWQDDEYEWITISSQRDLAEAWEFAQELPNRLLKIKLFQTRPSKIALRTWRNLYVCAELNGDAIANRERADIWEHFKVENHGDYVHLKSHHGMYLCAEPNGRVVCDRPRADIWERWTITEVGPDQWSLRSYHGKFLCAERDNSLVANRNHNRMWEFFTVESVPQRSVSSA
eukprot:TRINITY_DN188_c1_g1_i1.p1 TRINITY_DN188_c1_g1~~TRINITY_DN188_c1_g1_i1.p1  ORF type:complete len:216 (-),score=34.88 TRINITY_DN188_c1_g1_i1:88-735(-)